MTWSWLSTTRVRCFLVFAEGAHVDAERFMAASLVLDAHRWVFDMHWLHCAYSLRNTPRVNVFMCECANACACVCVRACARAMHASVRQWYCFLQAIPFARRNLGAGTSCCLETVRLSACHCGLRPRTPLLVGFKNPNLL